MFRLITKSYPLLHESSTHETQKTHDKFLRSEKFMKGNLCFDDALEIRSTPSSPPQKKETESGLLVFAIDSEQQQNYIVEGKIDICHFHFETIRKVRNLI